ncbi:MAG: hypothetical protein OXR68_05280 [Alphaproteobacteria bacterium]|nr:hypothetical protein [Alphaproteobacteria bacterium]MDD9920016.1 hypothetical protein [Alphaproteobacteria bacterium]
MWLLLQACIALAILISANFLGRYIIALTWRHCMTEKQRKNFIAFMSLRKEMKRKRDEQKKKRQ